MTAKRKAKAPRKHRVSANDRQRSVQGAERRGYRRAPRPRRVELGVYATRHRRPAAGTAPQPNPGRGRAGTSASLSQ
jgi:hypothetical protein